VWEIAACIDGYNRANAPDGGPVDPPSVEEFEAAKAAHGD